MHTQAPVWGQDLRQGHSPSENKKAQNTKRKAKKEEHRRLWSGKETASIKYFQDLETRLWNRGQC